MNRPVKIAYLIALVGLGTYFAKLCLVPGPPDVASVSLEAAFTYSLGLPWAYKSFSRLLNIYKYTNLDLENPSIHFNISILLPTIIF